jgi:co-chaperonin GroES (HSP10)
MYNKKEIAEMIKPLRGDVLVKVVPPKTITKAGIIINTNRDSAFSEILTYEAEVLRLGPKCKTSVKVGDIVEMDVFAGTAIPVEGDDYIKVIPETMIVGIHDKPETMAEDAETLSIHFKPNFERVLVLQNSLQPMTDGGIILTKQQSSPFELETLGGEILAVSDDIADEWEVGEQVRFDGAAGTPVKFGDLEGEDVRVMPYHMIMCKVDK